MFRLYLKTALRNFWRHRLHSGINLGGLTISLVCALFILLHVLNQLGFDSYHSKADRIYRVALDAHTPSYTSKVIRTGHPLADRLLLDYPEVEATTRLWNDFNLPMAVTFQNQRFMETGVMFADSNFFDVFTVNFLQGDPATALRPKNAVILTPAMAQKYFGDDDPLGQVIRITSNESDGVYVVTAIAEPMPAKSHFHFDFLASLESVDIYWKERWIPIVPVTYLVLAPGQKPAQLEAKFDGIVAKYVAPRLERDTGMPYEVYKRQGYRYRLFLQPPKSIHLYSNLDEIEPSGGIVQLRLLALIGVFILLLAAINFVNLSTAYAGVRAKEVGVRKTLGSHKSQLVRGFLFESVCLSLIALGLALVVTPALIELMNPMLDNPIPLKQLLQPPFLLGAVAFTVGLGLLAGVYPSFFLSNQSPVATLKGELHGMKKSALRNVLVVFQFAVSIILMIGALLVKQQLNHLQNKELGFEKENILAVERSHATIDQLKRFKQVVLEHAGVVQTSITSRILRRGMISTNFRPQRERLGNEINLAILKVDENYFSTLGIEVLHGRAFRDGTKNDSMAVLLNETAVEALGLKDPVGQQIYGWLRNPHTIIGVVRDFHVETLHASLKPLVILSVDLPWHVPYVSYVLVRLQPRVNTREMLTALETSWQQLIPDKPFEFTFVDQHLDRLYRSEEKTGKLFDIFTVLALCIACLGLFGLVTFITERRAKEIGIRKVLGATVSQIVILFVRAFGKPIAMAFALAVPLSIWIMDKWLQSFNYRIDIGGEVLALAGALSALLAFGSIAYRVIHAALRNSVEVLKYE